MADEQWEDGRLSDYYKAKRTDGIQKTAATCGNADACDSDSSSHQVWV